MAKMNYATSLVGPNTGFQNAQYIGNLLANPNSQGLFNQMQYGSPSYNGQGGSGQGGVSPYDVPGQYQAAYNEAKLANEQRYNDILQGYINREQQLTGNQAGQMGDVLDGYENRYQRGMENLQGLGDQEKADTSQRYKNLASQNTQDMVSRGLTGTTIMPTMRQGIAREESDALSRVNERLQRERLNYDASLSGDALSAQERQYGQQQSTYGNASSDTLGFMERRSDTYPDFNQLAALGQAYGAGGGSGGMAGVPQGVNLAEFGYQLPGMQNGQLNFGGGMPVNANMGNGMNMGGNAAQAMNPLQQMQYLLMMQQLQQGQQKQAGVGAAAHVNAVSPPPRPIDATPRGGGTGGMIGPPVPPRYGTSTDVLGLPDAPRLSTELASQNPQAAELVQVAIQVLGRMPESQEEFFHALQLAEQSTGSYYA